MTAILILSILAVVLLVSIFFLERAIHRFVFRLGQHLFFDDLRAVSFHAILFLPGVALHELAHYLTAVLLGVPTGKFSLIPTRRPDGGIRFGYVEVGRTDPLRESLVGAAPLLFGVIALYVIGTQFNLSVVVNELLRPSLPGAVAAFTASPWSPLFIYLAFAISNSMMPSPSDRRAFIPAAVILLGVVILLQMLGVADTALQMVAAPALKGLSAVVAAWVATVILNLSVLPILWTAERFARGQAEERRKRLGM